MKKEIIAKLKITFGDYVNEADGIEFWFARDLQVLPGYAQWRNFLLVLNKAKESCKNSGQMIENHFADVSKKVKIGSGAEREILNLTENINRHKWVKIIEET